MKGKPAATVAIKPMTRIEVGTIGAVLMAIGLVACSMDRVDKSTISGGRVRYDCVLVVLGNEPLDDLTPTVDTVARVEKSVAFFKDHPRSLLVFTGGKTSGSVSEAKMMAEIAIKNGTGVNS